MHQVFSMDLNHPNLTDLEDEKHAKTHLIIFITVPLSKSKVG